MIWPLENEKVDHASKQVKFEENDVGFQHPIGKM